MTNIDASVKVTPENTASKGNNSHRNNFWSHHPSTARIELDKRKDSVSSVKRDTGSSSPRKGSKRYDSFRGALGYALIKCEFTQK